MYTYTSEFDKKPLTAYAYVNGGSNFTRKSVVAYYREGIYYVDRNQYTKNTITGHSISGSENLNFENFSLTEDASGYFWVASENNGQIIVSKHSTGILEDHSFFGKTPNIISNKTAFSGDYRLSCFYVSGSNIYIRSSQDNFSQTIQVTTGDNINEIIAIRILQEPYTGYLGIFCKKINEQPCVYLNNFNLYAPLWNYNNYLFQDFESEVSGVTDGYFSRIFYLESGNSILSAEIVSYESYGNYPTGVNITVLTGINQISGGHFING